MSFAARIAGRLRAADRLSVVGTFVVALEVALIAIVIWSTFRFQQASEERVESLDSVGSVLGVYLALVDAESGQRGYIITGQDAYLDPYRSGLDRLDQQMAELRAAVAGKPDEEAAFAQLETAVANKRAELQGPVELRQAGNAAAAQAAVTEGSGRQFMVDVRTHLTSIFRIESARLQDATDDADNLGVLTGVSAVVLSIVTLVVVWWLVLIIRRSGEAHALRQLADAKDEFVGFVSHELGTPIAVIAGNARLLEQRDLSADDRREVIASIGEAGERLQAIVSTLLNLSKAEAGGHLAVEPVLVQRVAETVRRNHEQRFPGRRVIIEAPNEVPPALGDQNAIQQVLINLLSNAEKYGDPEQPIRVVVDARDETVSVSVTNEGEHLNAEEFAQIFDPYFRMSSTAGALPGVGLGLTVCHRLITAQRGRLAAEPLPAGGARFSFELPAAPVESEDFDAAPIDPVVPAH